MHDRADQTNAVSTSRAREVHDAEADEAVARIEQEEEMMKRALRRSPSELMRGCSIMLLVLLACAQKHRVVFHPSDRMFFPKPGARPAAYTRSNVTELPNVPMRSVGTIEVVISRGDMKRAIELATEKGRELGCWVIVERGAFDERRATRGDDARIILVHGGPPHAPNVRPRSDAVRFECVIRLGSSRRAGGRSGPRAPA